MQKERIMTIDKLFIQYFELKKARWSKHTTKTNLSSYNNHIYPHIGRSDINTLNFIDYQKLVNKLLDHRLSPKTVKNIFVIVTGIVTFAIKTDLYDGKNYVQYVELPDFDNKVLFTVSVEQQKKYIRALMDFNEPIYKDIFFFLLHGRRLNEVLGLEWEYIDLEQGLMYLPSARNKSRKNLIFQMTDSQIDILRAYHTEAILSQNLAMPKGHVFLNPRTGFRFTDIRKAWHRLLDRNELPHIRLHDIRHLVGTYLVNELNTPIEHVSHLLGHSSIQVTQRYVNPKPSNAKNAMNALFKSVRDKGELAVDELNKSFRLGEAMQEVLKLN